MKRRRFQRFEPNAIDGDNDGRIQDSTPWERPATPNVSGSMRPREPEMWERPKRNRLRNSHRRFLGTPPEAGDDAIYDESVGPRRPSRNRDISTRTSRNIEPASSFDETRPEIQESRRARAAYWEQYRDPETGKLNIPDIGRRPYRHTSKEKLLIMREGLEADINNGLTGDEIARKYGIREHTVRTEARRRNLKIPKKTNTENFTPPRRISGSMNFDRYNPPKPPLRDIFEDLPGFDDNTPEPEGEIVEKPKQFNVANISTRQWNEFSSDMMDYMQQSLKDPEFEYGTSKTRSRERRRSLLRAIAAIRGANLRQNPDGTLSMDFTDDGIRRLRTVLRVLQEQGVEGIRHIDLLRENLPSRQSRKTAFFGQPTRVLIDVKDALGQPRKIRLGDPDVFDNQTTAQNRAREMGCIGIRRYSTVNGGVAWMPCTNESDYRRRRGIGPQAQRDRRRREQAMEERIARRVGRLMLRKSVGINILENSNRRDSVIQFMETGSDIPSGKRFIASYIQQVSGNE